VQKLSVEMGKRPEAWRMTWSGDDLAPMDEEQMKALRESLKGLENLGPSIEKGLKGNKMKIYTPRGGGFGYWFGRKPILGVELVNTTPELREALGARKDAGVLVGKVLADSAAEKAGLKAGDIILSVDGNAVVDPGSLSDEIEEREGKTADLEILRDKRPMHIKVTLPAVEDDDAPRGPRAQLYRIPAIAPVAPLPPPVPAVAPAPPAPPAPPALPRTLASVIV
jgi:predicted metalloprotease with PDZ domain